MLHHVIDWQKALSDMARVLRPGGALIGYDLSQTRLAEWVHVLDRSPYQLIGREEFGDGRRLACITSVWSFPSTTT